MLKRYSNFILPFLGVADIAATAAAWAGAYLIRIASGRWGLTSYDPPTLDELLPYALLTMVLCPLIYGRMGLYGPKRTASLLRELTGVARAVVLVWLLTWMVIALTRTATLSRITMLSLLVVWLLLAFGTRSLAQWALHYLRSHGANLRRAAIVGAGRLGQKLHHALNQNAWTGIRVEYFVDDNVQPGRKISGVTVRGPIDNVEAILDEHPVDIVFAALPGSSQNRLEEVIDVLSTTHVDLRVVPSLLGVQLLRHQASQLDDLTIISLTHSSQQGWNSLLKWALDFAVSLVALTILAVPMLLIALLVKCTSKGPILYRQIRTSIGDQPFAMLKFRTMVVHTDGDAGPNWTAKNDARVTPLGRLLRKTSLDELPQLINVLKGDMSLVGPRPERPELIERFRRQVPHYMLRHQVRAGITGWAQVHGLRGQTSLRKRIQYDLFYIRNWSLALDLWIMVLTPIRGMVNANAY
ncbi:MAG: undecaprenyl-phosphate glucose phosphotransferase [Planctomycetaceae bacterium]|nr:undecaprenyl-phosphate glucose phosphotransferase [Planctomycetaceae bacterium]